MKPFNRKILVFLACAVIATFYILWTSQPMNLGRIENHIRKIQPEWQAFQRENNGFEDVRFSVFTGGNGMFAAVGEVATVAERAKLKEFMESTNPPRPIFLRSLRVLELEEKLQSDYEALKEAEQD